MRILRLAIVSIVSLVGRAAARNFMAMGATALDFVDELEMSASISHNQAEYIKSRLLLLVEDGDDFDDHHVQESAFATEMSAFITNETESGQLTYETARYLFELLRIDDGHASVAKSSSYRPAPATYTGNGNVVLLGTADPDPGAAWATNKIYNGIWGYSTGNREYALQCNSNGLHIIDVTFPDAAFRVQFIPMPGGKIWRDVETHLDTATGKTYAYVAAQNDGNFWVVDLSYLSGFFPHATDSNPIPTANGHVDRGRTNYGHTLSIHMGLLFLNSAGAAGRGCQIFDLVADPWRPPLVGKYRGAERDCHDSFAREKVNVPGLGERDLLYSADGFSGRFRIVDITGIRNGVAPVVLGETNEFLSIYAHSCYLSEDSHTLYVFDEKNIFDIGIYNVSDPTNMELIGTFQYSGHTDGPDSIVHNGQVRGNYLLVAYYEVGFRVFDVSNPTNPVEVGKYETYRDPDGDGDLNSFNISGVYEGSWNLYSFLPSGNVLVSDVSSGTFIFKVNPVDIPNAPRNLSGTWIDSGQVSLEWAASPGSTGYIIKRASQSGGPYDTVVANNVVETKFTDDEGLQEVVGATFYYIVKAFNAEGTSSASNEVPVTIGTPNTGPTLSPLGPTTCSDLDDWKDLLGYQCSFHAFSDCVLADMYANEGHTARTACCACGGGTT